MSNLSVFQNVIFFGALILGFYIVYVINTTKKKITLDGYLLAKREVSGAGFLQSFTVVGISSNLIFFVEAHREYGYLMCFGPLFYVAIQLLFLCIFNSVPINFQKVRSIADIWSQAFTGKAIARFIAILCAWNCILIVFVEILIGTQITSVIFNIETSYKPIIFFFFSVIILSYISYFGYNAVAKTAAFKLVMVTLAIVMISYFSINAPVLNNKTASDIFSNIFSHSEDGWSLITFLIWASWLNVASAFTDISLWQRMAASVSIKESFQSFVKGLWKWFVIFMLPIMCFVILNLKGYHYDNISEFLTIVKLEGNAVILTLITIGIFVALFATADTSLIGAIYALVDNNTFLPKLKEVNSKKHNFFVGKYLTLFILTILAVLSVLYYLVQYTTNQMITPLLYATWGQLCLIAPLIIYALFRLIRKESIYVLSQVQNVAIIAGVIFAWSIIIYTTYIGEHISSQLALVFGSLFVYIVMYIAINLHAIQFIFSNFKQYILGRLTATPVSQTKYSQWI